MKPLYIYILLVLSTIIYIPSTYAQQYAVTEDGRRVILHRDGTWEYLHMSEHHSQGTGESGNTHFEYSFFNGKLTEISGHTPGIKITVY